MISLGRIAMSGLTAASRIPGGLILLNSTTGLALRIEPQAQDRHNSMAPS
jgi:hypothetical protein